MHSSTKRLTPPFILLLSPLLFAGEVTIPHQFQAETPAVAAEVNANFDAVATAVNGNAADITTNATDINDNVTDIAANAAAIADLQSSLTALTSRVSVLEGISIDVDTYFGTDLFWFTNTGNFSIPTGTAGNQSESITVDTGFEYYPVPGLDEIVFEVTQDNTVVFLETNGFAYGSGFQDGIILYVAIEIDGVIPSVGAEQHLKSGGDDNLSGMASENWHINYPVVLNAGTHTFSVVAKTSSQSQTTVLIDGRSIEGYPGYVKATVTQLNMP